CLLPRAKCRESRSTHKSLSDRRAAAIEAKGHQMKVLSLRLCAVAAAIFLFQAASAQDSNRDYSKFLHSSQKHSSLACNSCHERTDNSATPRFPGHKACTDCHRSSS